MRIRVIGSGVAGSLLAWRLAQRHVFVELVLGQPHHLDATSVSGGIVRGYEPTADQRALATDSLLELAADPRLRDWARYREVSSMWAVADLGTLREAAAELDRRLPGSVELVSSAELVAHGWVGLPSGGGAICERQAGHYDSHALRSAVLADLSGRSNVTLERQLRPHRVDAVVVAAGAWTARVLAALCRPAHGSRTKSIQYSVHRTGEWRPTPFADTVTGLYGRPVAAGLLLGLPTEAWDVDPGRTRVDSSLVIRAAELAEARFPRLELGPASHQVSAADCYTEPPLLALRPAGANTYTFTGGSGGAAKSALAASTRAATALLHTPSLIGQVA